MNKKHILVLLLSSSFAFAQEKLKEENYEKYITSREVNRQTLSVNEGLFSEDLMSYPGYGTTKKYFVVGQLGITQNVSVEVDKDEKNLLVSFIVNFTKVDTAKELNLIELKVPNSMSVANTFVQLAVKNAGNRFALSLVDTNNTENRANPVNSYGYNEDHLVVMKVSNFNTNKATCELFMDTDVTNLGESIAKLEGLKLPANKIHENAKAIVLMASLHQAQKMATVGKVGLLKIFKGSEKNIDKELMSENHTRLITSKAKQGSLQIVTNKVYRNAEVIIYNAAGSAVRVLSNVNLTDGNMQELKMDPLLEGLYIFTIKDTKNQFQTKFIAH